MHSDGLVIGNSLWLQIFCLLSCTFSYLVLKKSSEITLHFLHVCVAILGVVGDIKCI